MKIIEKIIEIEIANLEDRLETYKKLGGPQIIIKTIPEKIEKMKNDGIKITDKDDLGQMEYISHEVKKGRGGKIYIHFNDCINYFPNGYAHGAFLAKNNK